VIETGSGKTLLDCFAKLTLDTFIVKVGALTTSDLIDKILEG
jgi:hypothetical protein